MVNLVVTFRQLPPIVGMLIISSTIFAGAAEVVQPSNIDATLGAPLYKEYCAACHGANLQGQDNWQSPDENGILPAPPHDQTGHTWHHDDGLLFDYIKLGGAETLAQRGVANFNSGMPAFAEPLSDLQIWQVLAFIKSTWPKQIQMMQAERSKNP